MINCKNLKNSLKLSKIIFFAFSNNFYEKKYCY